MNPGCNLSDTALTKPNQAQLAQAEHNGVQDEQAGHQAAHGLGEAMLIGQQIQAHRGCGNDIDGQRVSEPEHDGDTGRGAELSP